MGMSVDWTGSPIKWPEDKRLPNGIFSAFPIPDDIIACTRNYVLREV